MHLSQEHISRNHGSRFQRTVVNLVIEVQISLKMNAVCSVQEVKQNLSGKYCHLNNSITIPELFQFSEINKETKQLTLIS